MRNVMTVLCATAAFTGCVSIGGSPAYYRAPQHEVASAAVLAFQQAELPVSQVSDHTVSTREFDAGSAWTAGQIRERVSCGPIYPSTRVTSLVLTIRADIMEEHAERAPGARRVSTTDTRIFNETAVRLTAKGEMVADGKKRRCSISPQFSDMLLTQVGLNAGAEPRRERGTLTGVVATDRAP